MKTTYTQLLYDTDTQTSLKDRVLKYKDNHSLDGTIPEGLFIQEMIRVWKGRQNKNTDKFVLCWKGILECINRSLTGSSINISSATMGAGKTTASVIAISIYSILYPERGSLMICRTKKECDEHFEDISQLIGENNVLSLHSDTNTILRRDSKIKSSQVILTTHIRYLSERHFINGVLEYFGNNSRTLTIVDESLAFIVRYNISTKFIGDIRRRMGYFLDPFYIDLNYPKQYKKLVDLYYSLDEKNKQLSDGDKINPQLVHNVLSGIESKNKKGSLITLAKYLSSTKEDQWNVGYLKKQIDEWDFFSYKETLVNDILSLQSALSLSFWTEEDETNNVNYASGELMTRLNQILLQKNNTNSCVILDATTDVDKTYHMMKNQFGECVHIQPIIHGIRDYSSVEIFVRSENSGTGKNKSIKASQTRSEKILDWSEQEFGNEENRMLFVGTKILMNALKSEAKRRGIDNHYEFIHFGAIDGRNDLDHFHRMCVLSIPNSPRFYHEQTAIALHSQNILETDEWSKLREELETSYILVKLLQALGRDSKRRVTTENGGCNPCQVYLLLSGSKPNQCESFESVYFNLNTISKSIVDGIQKTFNNSKINSWKSFVGWNDRGKGKPNNDFTVSILHWVNTNIEPGESMKTQEIFDLMRITEDKTPHFKKLFTNQNLSSSSFGSRLREYGFTWFSKKGRNGYTVLSRK